MSLNHSETYTIFLFPNSHAAIKAELTVKKVYSAEVSRLIPLPPEVSAGCGMVLRVVPTEAASVKKLLEEASVPVEGTYTLKVTDGKREVTLAEA